MMKAIGKWLLYGLMCVPTLAIADDSAQTFEVVTGTLKVTPARCPIRFCKPVTYHMGGNFTAVIGKELIQFPTSNFSLTPQYEYELPLNPDLDEGGTTRKVAITYRNNHLTLKGSEDMRAFDGPLVEYQVSANAVSATADFNTFNFYTARQDFRKCAAPFCGGYFIKAVNTPLTTCADGSSKSECYVADIAFGSSGLRGATSNLSANPYLIQGSLTTKKFPNKSTLGYFKATSAYRALGAESATGIFAGIQNNGIMCITSPCFSYDELVLNSKRERRLSSVNFDGLQTQGVDVTDVVNRLGAGEIILAAGVNQQTQELAGPGLSFVINNVFVPLKPQ